MRRDDVTNDSEETATAFSGSKISHNSRTWLESVSFRRIATVEQLQLEHTQSALPYPSCGYASRHNYFNEMLSMFYSSICFDFCSNGKKDSTKSCVSSYCDALTAYLLALLTFPLTILLCLDVHASEVVCLCRLL